jgi:hypothetical protein
MRRIMAAAAFALSTASANAGMYLPEAPRVPPNEYDLTLVCQPGFDPTDRNPPRAVMIDMHVMGGRAMRMEVAYDLANGERVFRSRQYNAQLSEAPGPDYFAGWTGVRLTDARISMAGAVFANDSGWHYREKLWKSGHVEWDYTARCNRVDAP